MYQKNKTLWSSILIFLIQYAVHVPTLSAWLLKEITEYLMISRFVWGTYNNFNFRALRIIWFNFRWKPLTYIHNVKGTYWKLVLGLGNMDSSQEILDNGFMFSVFESGPWVAFKFPNNPSTGWIGGGTELFELMV